MANTETGSVPAWAEAIVNQFKLMVWVLRSDIVEKSGFVEGKGYNYWKWNVVEQTKFIMQTYGIGLTAANNIRKDIDNLRTWPAEHAEYITGKTPTFPIDPAVGR